MKTDLLRNSAIALLRVHGLEANAAEAEAELKALEDSHAEMARALLLVMAVDASPDGARVAYAAAETALKKAGVL